MRLCVVIPTYNESAAIGDIVREIRTQGRQVVVVDDGSSDNTARISQDCGAVVMKNSKNQGKGFSLLRGLKYVLEHNFEAAIIMDGDGQHEPKAILSFIREAEQSEAGIIIGNRMHNPRTMPIVRVMTNKFMSWLISGLIKQNVPDTQCGFRLIKREVLERIKFTTRRFETESEILIRASQLGYKIESLPIKSVYQREKSQINPFFDTLRFIYFIFRQIWTIKS
ncbi:MAG: glycosyltransferase family 2 protein [Candidatus Omnitrophota bacterium]